MARGKICKNCRNKEFDKTEQLYGYRPNYLWNEPYTYTTYIKKNIKDANGKYKSKWIKVGFFCLKCHSFYPYFEFPRIKWSKYKY
ncbi:MAG: hypothetical protein KGD63_05930 [Candidatus Lokiarchaeota archaeon]|nr:hypothetical protein [Candidatus Lokiarchaeota archaeon]